MRLKSYLTYRKQRVNAYGIHSPFVFEFYTEVLSKFNEIKDTSIQELKSKLRKDNSKLEITDLGAGSKKLNRKTRTVAEIARTSAISPKFGKLLTSILDFYNVETCLELGTSLGIGTAYLSLGKQVKKIVTIEGCPEISLKAKENFTQLQLENVYLINGSFEDKLDEALKITGKPDLIYIDGNHRYKPTIDYFNRLIDAAHENTILIFDDIHWSDEMEKAWAEISLSPKVNVTIDLFRLGIAIKRPGQQKQHFVLKF